MYIILSSMYIPWEPPAQTRMPPNDTVSVTLSPVRTLPCSPRIRSVGGQKAEQFPWQCPGLGDAGDLPQAGFWTTPFWLTIPPSAIGLPELLFS